MHNGFKPSTINHQPSTKEVQQVSSKTNTFSWKLSFSYLLMNHEVYFYILFDICKNLSKMLIYWGLTFKFLISLFFVQSYFSEYFRYSIRLIWNKLYLIKTNHNLYPVAYPCTGCLVMYAEYKICSYKEERR